MTREDGAKSSRWRGHTRQHERRHLVFRKEEVSNGKLSVEVAGVTEDGRVE